MFYPVNEIFGFVGDLCVMREVMQFVTRATNRVDVVFAAKRHLETN